mgnify:CR=1 FL=1
MFACGGGKFCYNNLMNKIVNVLKKYMYVVSIFIVVSIILGVSYSNFIVTSNNHKAAEMYIGALKYSIEIDGNSTNTLSVPTGETIIDVKVSNLNPVDTYYKLLYLKNSNLTVKYFGLASELDNSNNVTKAYDKPNDSVTSSNSKTIKLQITNNSTSSQTLGLSVKGGYITNTLSDIATPSNYSEIFSINTKASTYFCTTTNTLTQGLKYVNGQYTYAYKQEGQYASSGLGWSSISNNGWGVQLTDKTSTDVVTSKVCTYINNKPVTSMRYMFCDSQATTLDLSNFDTSNVTNMNSMFGYSEATTLDLSSFDTSKVTNMNSMFSDSQATILDVSNFDTSKVTNMSLMFYNSQATTLDVSNFDTSKVTNMNSMFFLSKAATLDVSNFDTSKVTDMSSMFDNSQVTTLDVSTLDTSQVTTMNSMFYLSKTTTLDLSNFNTSNVTDMGHMFYSSENLKTIYVSNKFKIDNVTSSNYMFTGATKLVGGAGTKYDANHVDKVYAHIDGGTSNPGYFTDIADKDIPAPNAFATDSWKTIIKAVRNNNISKYNVGDTKEITLDGYGTHTLRLANKSTPSECSTSGFSQSACGFVIEFEDIITEHVMNDTATNVGGWPASEMYSFVNNDIYNSLPNDLKNGIIDTTVISGHGNDSGDESNFTSIDKLYLLSLAEVSVNTISSPNTKEQKNLKIISLPAPDLYGPGKDTKYDSAEDVTRQLDYYKNMGVTKNNYDGAIKKNGTNADWWWLRTAASTSSGIFLSVGRISNTSSISGYNAFNTFGVSPAFRLG